MGRGGEMDGYASIVGDTYQGTGGKVILVSPHPEHDKLQNCDIVTYMAAYAAGVRPPVPTPGPSPAPIPTPIPAPVPSPAPSVCRAISAMVTDDWCRANCAQ